MIYHDGFYYCCESRNKQHSIFLRAIKILLLALFVVVGSRAASQADESSNPKLVKVITKRNGDRTRFFVDNREAGEVTATFTVGQENLSANVHFPFTATYPAGKMTEAFTLTPIEPRKGWNYDYTSQFTLGNFRAVHDDSCIYLLPYAAGTGFRVTQGYNGSYSHSGPDQFAIDFKMPLGTPVHAARAGVVVKVKEESDCGGPSRKYESCANYILIRHDDATLANYAHLQKGASRVRLGERVEAGQLIALSGNTGFTSGPHLHFSVFKTRADGGGRESIAVRFKTVEAPSITLLEGQTYKPVLPAGAVEREPSTAGVHKRDRKGHAAGAPQRD